MSLPSKLLSYYWASLNLDPSQTFIMRVASKQQKNFSAEPFLAIAFLLNVSPQFVRVIPSIAMPTFGELRTPSPYKSSSKCVSFDRSVREKRFSGEDSVTSEGVTSEVRLRKALTPRDDNQRPSRGYGRQYHSEHQWMRKSWRKRTPARQIQSERRYRAPQKQYHWRQPEPELEGNSIAEMLHQIHQPKRYRYRNSSGFQSNSRHSNRNSSRGQRSRRQHQARDGPSAMLQRMIAQDC